MKKFSFTSQIIIYFVLIGGALLFSMPLLWMLSTALKPIEQTMSMPPSWLPFRYYVQVDGQKTAVKLRRKIGVKPEKMKIELEPEAGGKKFIVPVKSVEREVEFRWENFADAIKAMRYFPKYLRNTLLLCFLTVAGTVISSSLAAYGFSRIMWRGRDKVFLILLATMMIPFPVIMVPMYCLFRYLGLIGTLTPLWIGSFCAGAFNVFLLRQFFIGLPQSLSDAARIDGCNELQIFWHVILPMSKPALMVVGLFQFMATWNDFLGPLLYLTDQKDYTLALGLQFFQSQSGGTEWNYLMAASALIVIPVIILFFFTQKSFIEGISTTGVKG